MALRDLVFQPIAKATANYLRSATQQDMEKAYEAPARMVRRSAINASTQDLNTRKKPSSSVSFETLRQFSVTHEVARICINARKRQISSLDWDIVPTDPEDKTDYKADINLIKAYFKNLGGYRMRFRKLQDLMIEDLLVLDAICLYKQPTRGGDILYYMPVDAATIKLRVDEAGGTPMPPEVAYKQYIRGKLIAEFTADQMIYEMMNPRTDTPYGLAPLESLIMVVTAALKSELYNLDFLTSGNIPEGLLSLPDGWSTKQIDEFMNYFDALVSGNTAETAKMKPVPGGSTFTETKKRSDMAFKEFNDWLMRITCAMFDIQPQEIGFTDQVNKANGSEQNDIATRRGILPLANLMMEIFNDIIQIDLGYPTLKFQYVGLEDRDQLLEAQTQAARLGAGIITIDEARKEEGLDPIGIDRPYVLGIANFINDAQVHPEDETAASPDGNDGVSSTAAHDDETEESGSSKLVPGAKTVASDMTKTMDDELKRFETFAVRRVRLGKSYRPFESDVLDGSIVKELNTKLATATDVETVRKTIGTYKGRGTPRFLAKSDSTDDGSDDTTDEYEHNPTLDVLVELAGYSAFANDFRNAILSQAQWTADNLKEIETKVVDQDLTGLTSVQRSQVISYLSANMPVIADKVSSDTVLSWYKQVADSSVNALYDSIGSDVVFDLRNAATLDELAARADTLLTKSTLDETTKKRLAKLIVDDKAAGMTTAEIKADILSQFEDISKVRAGMIAHTETVNLMNQMQFYAMQRANVQMKEWVEYGPNPCQICDTNAGQGPIPMDAMFDSGDLMPSAHIGCECGLDYLMQEVVLADLWDGE